MKNAVIRYVLTSLALVATVALSHDAEAVDAPVVPSYNDSTDVARAEKNIPVPQAKSDKEIAERLCKIFYLTGWFENLKVTSQEGVVTIHGKVQEVSQRDWAVKLAQDAEGVVAVIDKIDMKELGWFDFTPARRELRGLWKHGLSFLPHAVLALLILVVATLAYRFASNVNRKLWAPRIANPVLSEVFAKIGALPVLLLGLYLVLQVLGMTSLAFTILGGTGAIGLVAGFAFKNILENYFSGIMLSLRKPFIIGDVIEVAGYKGVVSRMTTRGTTLVDFDGNHILIPNSTVFTSVIKNQTASPLTRVHMTIDIDGDGTYEDQRQRVLKFLALRPEIVKNPMTEVFVTGQGREARIEAYFWINIRETSPEKLKALLSAKIKSGLPVTAAAIQSAEPSTKTEVNELLKQTDGREKDVKTNGHDLLFESR